MGRTTRRGYGRAHQNARARVKKLVDQGVAWCALCGGWIDPRQAWDLDHTPDRTGYRGPAHQHCNRSDGAKRGNASRRQMAATRWLL